MYVFRGAAKNMFQLRLHHEFSRGDKKTACFERSFALDSVTTGTALGGNRLLKKESHWKLQVLCHLAVSSGRALKMFIFIANYKTTSLEKTQTKNNTAA